MKKRPGLAHFLKRTNINKEESGFGPHFNTFYCALYFGWKFAPLIVIQRMVE